MQTLVGILLVVCLAAGARILYQQIYKPLRALRFYQKQGIQCQFLPFSGSSSQDARNVIQKGDYYYDWLTKARGQPKSKMFCKNVGSTCAVILTDPELIRQMFINKDDFVKHPFQNSLVKRLSPYGLVLLQGQTWKKHRRLISKGFDFGLIDGLLGTVRDCSVKRVQSLQDNQVIGNAFNFFKETAGNIISLTYFQEDILATEMEGKSMPVFLSDLISQLAGESYSSKFCTFGMSLVNLGLFKVHRKLLNKIETMRSMVRTVVRKHAALREERLKAEPAKPADFSMWDLFLGDPNFNEDEIIDEFITFFSDGVYTTGHFMTMLTYNLARNPSWKASLREQLKTHVSDLQKPNQTLMNNLPILQACIKQTLRLAPPVVTGIERIAVRDTSFADGTKILKDTMMMACHLVNHLDPNLHENPLEFNPNRWLDQNSKTMQAVKTQPGSFIPFSIGERQCPGQKFAMAEASIFFSHLLDKYDFEILEGDAYQLKFTQRFLREPLVPFGIKLRKLE